MELFFDLMMVFALSQVVAGAVPGLGSSGLFTPWIAVGRTLLLFAPLIWTWTITAYMTSRFDPRATGTQWSILVTAFAMVVMGTSVPHAFTADRIPFALAYVFIQVGRPLIFGYALGGHALARLYFRATVWASVGGLFWILGALTSVRAQVLLWILAVVIDFGSARLGWPVPRLGRGRTTVWAHAPHHLADRYQQLLLIALGETILAVGITYASGSGRAGGYESIGLLVTFVTVVLLWRIYFHRAGQVLGDAVAAARDPAGVGRFVASAHMVMIFGIVVAAIGHEIIQSYPSSHSHPAWLAMILGGPACYMVGRAALERAVFSRISLRRWVGIAVLLAAGAPLLAAPPLAAGITAIVVLLAIAVIDARRSAHRPPEKPRPADEDATWFRRRHP
ncbi:low temperature requirement protein A [Micromonospora sp. H33]|uniref:low temperature requirement protein A n=1 Tax=Micromonospora sp. H33 TaxID=3452215 RepID=UPI003F8C5771